MDFRSWTKALLIGALSLHIPAFGEEVGVEPGGPETPEAAIEVTRIADLVAEEEGEYFSLPEVIFLTLRDNESIESAYLSRITQRFTLRSKEHEYEPQGSITLGIGRTDTYNRDKTKSSVYSLSGPSLTLNKQLLSGGSFAFAWNNSGSWTKTLGNTSHTSNSGATTGLSLNFSQPLLKGGFTVAHLSLTSAYLTEEGNILSLKSTLINKITEVIKQYRTYIQQVESYEIQKRGVERTRITVFNERKKYEAGLVPENNVINNEANLASKELTLEQQFDTKDDARINLLRTMNVDTEVNLLPDLDTNIELNYIPTVEECLEIAFANEPSYLQQLISVRSAEIQLIQAKNGMLWDLKFDAGISTDSSNVASSLQRSNESAWAFKQKTLKAGLSATIPVNDISRYSSFLSARIGMRNAKISLRSKEEDMKKNFQSLLRSINSQIRQIEIAKRSTELARKDFEASKVAFRLGEMTSFEFNGKEDSLISAEQSEINARISLLNSLTDLDQQLGTTLQTWQIDIDRRAAQSPRFRNKFYKQMALIDERTSKK